MDKIMKIEERHIVVSFRDDLIRVPISELVFEPEVGMLVDVTLDGDEYIVNPAKHSGYAENYSKEVPEKRLINKILYIVLALFLGSFGVHKFYAGKNVQGILYFLFSWTFVPTLLSFVDIIKMAMRQEDTNGNLYV